MNWFGKNKVILNVNLLMCFNILSSFLECEFVTDWKKVILILDNLEISKKSDFTTQFSASIF